MFPTFTPEVRSRWVANLPLFVIGAVGVVGGGLASAVAGFTDWGHGPWTAAYTVLVVGVAQIVIAAAQASLTPTAVDRRSVWVEFAAWNTGSAIIIAGSQFDATGVVILGSAVFGIALGVALAAARGTVDHTGASAVVYGIYRVVLWILAVSVLIGILLSFVH